MPPTIRKDNKRHSGLVKALKAIERVQQMARKAANTNPVKIHSNGLAIDRQVGAAAILFDGDPGSPHRTLQYYLGPKHWHCSYQAEWIGAVLAAKLLMDYLVNRCNGIKISIYINNQSVVRALTPVWAQLNTSRDCSTANY